MIIVGDAAFEPGTPAPEVWFATNERPHLLSLMWLSILTVFVDPNTLNLNLDPDPECWAILHFGTSKKIISPQEIFIVS